MFAKSRTANFYVIAKADVLPACLHLAAGTLAWPSGQAGGGLGQGSNLLAKYGDCFAKEPKRTGAGGSQLQSNMTLPTPFHMSNNLLDGMQDIDQVFMVLLLSI